MHVSLCLGEERQPQFHHTLDDTAAGRDLAMWPQVKKWKMTGTGTDRTDT